MSLGNSSRRSGFGSQNRGMSSPGRPAASQPPQSSGRGGRDGDKPRSSWTTASTLYDPYHSCMEVQIVSEWYRTALCVKLAPVFAERRGPDDGGTGKKYDHDNAAMVVLDLNEAIVFKAQLEAFVARQLSEIVVARLETKRMILCAAEVYYAPDHPEYAAHANGLALAIEEDPSEKSDGKNVVFISRQQAVTLCDREDASPEEVAPVAFFPELQGLLAVIDSYIQNCARVDFGSVRLLENRGQSEERPAGPVAPMPTRRTGGLGAPTARPAATGAVRTSTSVSEDDLGAALDSAVDSTNVDDVLGDIPKF